VAAVTGAVTGLFLLCVGLSTLPAGADSAPSNRGSVTDRLADVVDLHAVPVTVPRADITGASVEYAPGWIRLEMTVFNATDPVKDPHWASDNTFAVWTLDTNADGKPDYLVEYGNVDGQLYGDVFRPGDGADDPSLCEADSVTHSGSAAGGVFTMEVDPFCLGRPSAIAYTVGISYDAGGGLVGTDIVPDTGFAAAVTAPAAPLSVESLAAPVDPTSSPVSVPVPVPGTVPATDGKQAPKAVSAPVPSAAPTPASKPAATSVARSAPKTGAGGLPRSPGSAPSANRTTTSVASSASAVPRPSATSAGELARTGAARLRPLSALGLGLVLMGAGLLVMIRRPTAAAI